MKEGGNGEADLILYSVATLKDHGHKTFSSNSFLREMVTTLDFSGSSELACTKPVCILCVK